MAEENPFARLFRQQSTTTRLAILEQGQPQQPLKIKLINADPRNTRYQCISYDRSKDFGFIEVEVDGQPYTVSKPLETALRTLRGIDGPRTFWADLLMGSTVEERSAQARELRTVFENAEKVIAWLGPGTDLQLAALDTIHSLANYWGMARVHANLPEQYTRQTMEQLLKAQAYLVERLHYIQSGNKDLWTEVQSILCTSYFETTQSIPDIVLAKTAVVGIGEKSIPWNSFAEAHSAFAMIALPLQIELNPKLPDCNHRIIRLHTATRRKHNGESLELFPMMKDARRTSFTDPKEIVFSVLPIATPCKRTENDSRRPALPVADYSKSTAEVFKQASKYIVEDRQDLMSWWYERPPCGRSVSGMPSWAVDWSSRIPDSAGVAQINPHNGLREWADPLNHKRIYVDDEDGLHVQAHTLDRVAHVSKLFTKKSCRKLLLEEWQKLGAAGTTNPQDMMDRYWRTLILNMAGHGETVMDESAKPSAEMQGSFVSLLSEERILQILDCTAEELDRKPADFKEQLGRRSDIQVFDGMTGYSQQFEALLRANTVGRRFFVCESGRFGMTALEEPPPPAEGEGASAASQVNFDAALGDPLGAAMMASFQQFLRQRDPHAANALAQGLQGTLPGQRPPGVRTGDLVVALIGGYQPYILRPVQKPLNYEGPSHAPGTTGGSNDWFEHGKNAQTDDKASFEMVEDGKYSYVGDCYLHGVMNAECFKETLSDGTQQNKAVKVVDVTIV